MNLLPPAPVDAKIDPTTDHVVTAIMAVFAVLALLFALVHWQRTGKPHVLLLWCAGGLMMFLEPMVDTVGACWFPDNSTHAFTLWGRPMPVWLCLTYFMYFGVGVAVTWLAFKRGLSAGVIWLIFLGEMVGDIVLETTLLHFDTWVYYGDQPLVVAKFPLWWAPVNALITMVAATLIYRLEGQLVGRRMLLIIPISVSASAAVNAVAGWPSWTAINSNFSDLVMNACGVVTFAIALWLMTYVVRAVAVPSTAEAPPPPRTPAFA